MSQKLLNLKEQFRYLVVHGVLDYGNSVGEACDKAYEIMLPKIAAASVLILRPSDKE